MMSQAPAMASFAVLTFFSSEAKASASFSSGSFVICRRMIFASGSNPFSFAIVARVRRFGRYGRYKSSTTTRVAASSMDFFSSAVSLPCSSMLARTTALRSFKLRRYIKRSYRFRSISSFKEPVASFRYREIKGIVFPSSISFTAASTCHGLTFSSAANT